MAQPEYKFITQVKPGDVIYEGGNKTPVKKVDDEICKNHVHINDKDCYDIMAEVLVGSD